MLSHILSQIKRLENRRLSKKKSVEPPKNQVELRYAYGLLMELSQHPKSSVRMAVLRSLGLMARLHEKAPLSETEIKDRIYAQWRQGDSVERALLKIIMEDLRQSRGWQFVLP